MTLTLLRLCGCCFQVRCNMMTYNGTLLCSARKHHTGKRQLLSCSAFVISKGGSGLCEAGETMGWGGSVLPVRTERPHALQHLTQMGAQASEVGGLINVSKDRPTCSGAALWDGRGLTASILPRKAYLRSHQSVPQQGMGKNSHHCSGTRWLFKPPVNSLVPILRLRNNKYDAHIYMHAHAHTRPNAHTIVPEKEVSKKEKCPCFKALDIALCAQKTWWEARKDKEFLADTWTWKSSWSLSCGARVLVKFWTL